MTLQGLALGLVLAQLSIPGVPVSIPVPISIPQIPAIPTTIPIPALAKERPVVEGTGTLVQLPELDDFAPSTYQRLLNLPRSGSAYVLAPGSFELIAQSFCLNAGAHGPNTTSPYQVATLGGSRGAIVQSVLEHWSEHPAIEQGTVQELLWAITAKAKVGTGDSDVDKAARELLSPQDVSQLNGGTLGVINGLLGQLGSSVPEPLRSILDAQNQIRDLLQNGNASYQELAQLAAPPAEDSANDGTRDRWSFNPQGYFVRFLPTNYLVTTVQVYVPSPYAVVRDPAGHLLSITDGDGNSLVLNGSTATFRRRVGAEARSTRQVQIQVGTDTTHLASVAHGVIASARVLHANDATSARAFGADLEAYAACRAHGACRGTPVAMTSLGLLGPSLTFAPTGNVGVPPSSGLQPVGTSAVPSTPSGPDDPKNDKNKDCDLVKHFLDRAKHFKAEYDDPDILAKAAKNHWSGQQYEDAVTAKDAATSTATGTAAGSVAAETYFDTCETVLPTPAQIAAKGWPYIIYTEMVAHEQQHHTDCLYNKAHHLGDTWSTRHASEDAAYDDVINILQKWIDDNC